MGASFWLQTLAVAMAALGFDWLLLCKNCLATKVHAPKARAVNESSMWLVARVFAATLQAQ
jgi:hypothetical protein